MKPPARSFARLVCTGLVLVTGTPFAADPPAAPRKDAAEAVGEGNVQQWIEYYQRSRPPAPPKPATRPASPDDPAPLPPPAAPPAPK